MSERDSKERINVIVRLRPDDKADLKHYGESCISKVSNKALSLKAPDHYEKNNVDTGLDTAETSGRKTYSYDRVYGPHARQEDVFAGSVEHLVDSVVAGYNATVFAYGATGSGKTHTMMGTDSQPGITPRAIQRLFKLISENSQSKTGMMFMVRMSFVELYHKDFRDLLEGSDAVTRKGGRSIRGKRLDEDAVRAKIDVRENSARGVYLTGSRTLRTPVTCAEEVMSLIKFGQRARAVGCTNLNEHSSRSHSILTLDVESKISGTSSNTVCMGKMHLVDLAGSERLSMSGAEGVTLKETASINSSLAILGNVLSALSSYHTSSGSKIGGRPPVIPYRHSKLTHLLKDSLGGNSKTIMLTTVRCPKAFYQQTKTSLMYSSRAKKIENSTKINIDSIGASEMQKVASQVDELKTRLLERTTEFNRIRSLHVRSAKESFELKQRVQEMARQNELEKQELQRRLNEVISNKEEQSYQLKDFEELQAHVNEYENTVIKQRQEISSLKKAVNHHGNEVQQLRVALQASQANTNRMRQQRDQATQRLEDESSRIRTIVNDWGSQKEAMKQKILQLEHELADSRSNEERIGVIKTEYAVALQEVDDLKERMMREKMLTEQKALEAKKSNILLTEVTAELAQLKNELMSERKRNMHSKQERQIKEEQFLKDMAADKHIASSAAKQVKDLQIALKKLRSSSEADIAELKENFQRQNNEQIKQMSAIKKRLRNEELAAKKSQHRYTEQIKAFDDEIRNYKKLVSELETTNNTLSCQIKMEKNTTEKMEKERSLIASATETKLSDGLKERDAKIADLREKRDKVQQQLRKAMDTMIQLQDHSQKNVNNCKTLEESLAELKKNQCEKDALIESLETQIANFDAVNDAKISEIEEYKKSIRSLEDKVQILTVDQEDQIHTVKDCRAQLVEKSKLISSQIIEINEYKSRLENVEQNLRQETSLNEVSRKELNNFRKTMQTETKAYENEVLALNKKVISCNDQMSQMTEENVKLNARINELTDVARLEKEKAMKTIETMTESFVQKSLLERSELEERLKASEKTLKEAKNKFHIQLKESQENSAKAVFDAKKQFDQDFSDYKQDVLRNEAEREAKVANEIKEQSIKFQRELEEARDASKQETETALQKLKSTLECSHNHSIFKMQQELKIASEKHQLHAEDLRAHHARRIDGVKQSARENIVATQHDAKELQKKISQDFEMRLKDITLEHQNKEEHLLENHQAECQLIREDYEKQIDQLKQNYARNLQFRIAEVENNIKKEEQQNWLDRKSKLEEELSLENDKRINDAMKEYATLERGLREENARLESANEKNLNKILELQLAADKLQSDYSKEKEMLELNHKLEIKTGEADFMKKWEEEKMKLQASFETRLSKEIESTKVSHQSKLSVEHHTKIEEYRSQHQRLLKDAEGKFEEKVKNLQVEHMKSMQLMEEKHRFEQEESNSKHEHRLIEMTEGATSKFISAQETWKTDLDLMKKDLAMRQESLDHLQEKYELKLSNIQRQHADEIKALQLASSNNTEMQQLKQKDALKTALAEQKDSYESELNALKTDMKVKFEVEKNEALESLKQQLELKHSEMVKKHTIELDDMNQKYTDLYASHREEITALTTSFEDKLEESKTCGLQELRALETEKTNLVKRGEEELKKALEAFATKCEYQHKQELDECKHKYAEELRRAHLQQVEEFDERLDHEKERIQEECNEGKKVLVEKYIHEIEEQKKITESYAAKVNQHQEVSERYEKQIDDLKAGIQHNVQVAMKQMGTRIKTLGQSAACKMIKCVIASSRRRKLISSFSVWSHNVCRQSVANLHAQISAGYTQKEAAQKRTQRSSLSCILQAFKSKNLRTAFQRWHTLSWERKYSELSVSLQNCQSSLKTGRVKSLSKVFQLCMNVENKQYFEAWTQFSRLQASRRASVKRLLKRVLSRAQHWAFVRFKTCHIQNRVEESFGVEKKNIFESHEIQLSEARALHQQLTHDNNEALVRIATEHQEKIASLIQKHEKEQRRSARNLERKHQCIEKKYLQATRLLRERVEEQTATIRELEAGKVQAQDAAKHAEELLAETSTSLDLRLNSTIESTQKEFEAKIAALISAKEASEQALQTALSSQMKIYEDKITCLNANSARATEEFQKQLTSLRKEHEKKTKMAMSECNKQNSQKLEEERQLHINEMEKLSSGMAAMQMEHEKQLVLLQNQYKLEAADAVQKSVSTKCNEIETNFRATTAKQEEAFRVKMNNMIEMERAKYEKMIEMATTAVATEKDDKISVLESTVREKENREEELKLSMTQTQANADTSAAIIAKLKAQIKSLREEKNKETNIKLQELEVRFSTQISSLKTAKESTEAALQKALKEQANNYDEKLKEATEKNRKNKTILRKALADQVKSYEEKLESAQDAHTGTIAGLKRQIKQLKEDHDSQLHKRIDESKAEWDKQKTLEIEEIKMNVQKKLLVEQENHSAYAKEVTAQLTSKHDAHVQRIEAKHAEDIVKTNIESEKSAQKKVDVLTAKVAMISKQYEEDISRANKQTQMLKAELVRVKSECEKQMTLQAKSHEIALHDIKHEAEVRHTVQKKALSDLERHLDEASVVASRSQTDVRKAHYSALVKVLDNRDARCAMVLTKKAFFRWKIMLGSPCKSSRVVLLLGTSQQSSFAGLVSTPSQLTERERSIKRSGSTRTPQAWKGISLQSSNLRLSPAVTNYSQKHQEEEFIANVHSAAYDGEIEELLNIVKSTSNPCAEGPNEPNLMPIHRAITGLNYHGDFTKVQKCIEVLVKNGFNLNQVDENGNTVLMHALTAMPAKKSISILRNIVSSQSVDVQHRNVDGETALHIEIRRMGSMSLSIIKMLVEKGADINAESKDGLTPLTLCVVLSRRAMGSPSTHSAGVWTGRSHWIPIVRYLISQKASWVSRSSIVDHCGRTPLHLLLSMPPPGISFTDEHLMIVENCLKLTKGFKPTIDINAEDRYGNTALLGFCKAIAEMPQRGEGRAFYKWATQIIDSMLSKGANPGIVSRHGLSPLDMAGYWDLAPEAKKLRLNGGTLYDLIWSQLALFTRKRDKENASTPTATVKKINGLIVKANVLSAESNRHINKLTPETLKSKAVEVSSAQRMDRKAMFGRDNVRYQDSSNSLDKH